MREVVNESDKSMRPRESVRERKSESIRKVKACVRKKKSESARVTQRKKLRELERDYKRE